LAYYPVREKLPALDSQMVCQAVHRVADAYKTLKANNGISNDKSVSAISFNPTSVNFDKRTYAIKEHTLSLFTLDGRVRIPFVCGKHQRNLLSSGVPKEAKLIVRKGVWHFNLVQDFVSYKAQGAGLSVVFINPAYTSQTCSMCGELGKRVEHRFSCSCGTRRHSDVNAALNIAGFAEPIGIARGGKVTRPEFAHRGLHDVVESSGL
jgi:hypothetical protein